MQINQYHLVKVLDSKWVNPLLDGGVFFRAVQCFADLANRTAESQNSFRGDVLEAVNYSDSNRFALIDALTYREKLYCMYALDYDASRGQFIKPDGRMADFGDTAVVITNSFEFLRRVGYAMLDRFGNDFWTGFDKVHYNVDLEKRQAYNEFCKSSEYLYQNEFRIVLDLANGKFHPKILERTTDFARMTFPGKIEIDENPDSLADELTLNIGNIRDICFTIPTKDLVHNERLINSLPVPMQIAPMLPPRQPKPTFFFMAVKLP